MKVKQIDPGLVMAYLMAGKEVCCVEFGNNLDVRDVGVYDCRRYSVGGLMEEIEEPGNLFFEMTKESEEE